MKAYDLLSLLLARIEENIKSEKSEADSLSGLGLSAVHLRRLFRFAFGRSLSGYIRSRKLASSLEMLFQAEMRIIDLAVEYGFQYEQTYIRAFKREFGLTPGECRESCQILRVTPPLHLFPKNNTEGDLLFGPDLVMMPALRLVGRLHKITFAESIEKASAMGVHFWRNERCVVPEPLEPNTYYGLTRIPDFSQGWSYYLPSMRVKKLRIPEGFTGDTFPASLCVGFRYLGGHHYYELNRNRAVTLYEAIKRLAGEMDDGYLLANRELYFERIDVATYDGRFCQMEWFTPVRLRGAKP